MEGVLQALETELLWPDGNESFVRETELLRNKLKAQVNAIETGEPFPGADIGLQRACLAKMSRYLELLKLGDRIKQPQIDERERLETELQNAGILPVGIFRKTAGNVVIFDRKRE